jgi:prepilin-type N-terminal cleavage/methylation domain-containing protein
VAGKYALNWAGGGLMKKGFTLIEIIIVVVIIGILVGIALPRYQKNVESARIAEAKTMLKAIHSAQMRYAQEYDQYTSGNLDIVVPEEGKFFTFSIPEELPCATDSNFGEEIAYAVRKNEPSVPIGVNPGYTVSVYEDGTFCSTDTWVVGICLFRPPIGYINQGGTLEVGGN